MALPIVLWALVALGALSMGAIVTATIERVLAVHHRHHAAALAHAEAGLAEALAVLASDPAAAAASDSVTGGLGRGGYRATWAAHGARLRMQAAGWSGAARRTIEAWVGRDAGGALWIEAWREER